MTSVRPSWGRGSRRRSIQPQHFIYARPSGDPGACPPSDGSGSPAARAGPARPPCRVTSNNAGEDFSSTRGPRMSTASTRASSSRPPSATRPTRSTGSSTTRLCCRSRSTPPTRTATPRSSSTPTTSSPAVRSRIHDIDRQRLHQARHPTHRRVHRYQLDDPVLSAIARIVHGADLDDERHDAPEAHGLDVLLRGLSMVRSDHEVLELSGPLRGPWGHARARSTPRRTRGRGSAAALKSASAATSSRARASTTSGGPASGRRSSLWVSAISRETSETRPAPSTASA